MSVYVKFMNAENNKLGKPLPAGIMRLYKADHDGSMQFIGEDRIQHTPKGEEIKLKIGNAFDVIAERKQTNYTRISKQMHESSWEVNLRNHKKEPIVVDLVENLSGNWQMTQNSHPYEKDSAFKVIFQIPIAADSEKKITYTVRVGI